MKMSKKPKPTLTVLDVGHGNSAVLRDLDNVVIFDAGQGQHLRRFLRRSKIKVIDAILISHADTDHCSGAISVLLDHEIVVRKVFLNPDATKKSKHSHRQLRLAVAQAGRERGTITETQLTTSLTGKLRCGSVHIEVLYPPPELAMSGVGGADLAGRAITSNAMSAAIRLTRNGKPLVLLGADIELSCLDHWADRQIDPSAPILLFPHHGGLPGTSTPDQAAAFACRVGQIVKPEIVVFSIHRSRHDLPREEVLSALLQALTDVHFLCTQVPARIAAIVSSRDPGPWKLHREKQSKCVEGNIGIGFGDKGYTIRWFTR